MHAAWRSLARGKREDKREDKRVLPSLGYCCIVQMRGGGGGVGTAGWLLLQRGTCKHSFRRTDNGGRGTRTATTASRCPYTGYGVRDVFVCTSWVRSHLAGRAC